ncbi:MAG TPA: 3D domain-containing protein [Syntrophomonas sp.]|nr:3D domain-containing protein [Syntrophomonas sp.]
MDLAWSKKGTILIASLLTLGILVTSMFFALQKPVTIAADGKLIQTRVLFSGTVKDVLQKNHIGLGKNDLVQPILDSKVTRHTQIVVTRAFKVRVLADGTIKTIETTPVTAEKAVSLAGFQLGENDIIKTKAGKLVSTNQEIEVIRVTEQIVNEDQTIPYSSEQIDDPTLERGLTKTVKAGKEGIARNTIKIIFYNGQEEKREIISTETLQEPQNRVVAMGSITSVSRGSERLDFREAKYMQASAYTYTGFRTATGLNPSVGMVAVDPNVIPMGSRLYIEGYGYARAADTGGAIKGNTVDLFMESYSQCINWGRRSVKVYVLN